MRYRATARGVEVWAPAKLNLFLEVLGKRDDGFHEIETLMCPVDLFDTLWFEPDPSGQITLSCQWAPGWSARGASELDPLPQSADNIVVRAAGLVRRRAGIAAGARLRLVKRIPTAAGLAGGSSDAAAALVAANQGWQARLPPEELARLAAEIGSDIPFFLGRGAAICRGRGEQIEPIGPLGLLHFVIVRPPAGLATAAVYRGCRPARQPHEAGALVRALQTGNRARAGRLLFNRLQPAAAAISPWIGRLAAEFARLDLPGHQMSGSGSSYFGLCRSAGHAQRVARQLEARGVGRVFTVRSCAA